MKNQPIPDEIYEFCGRPTPREKRNAVIAVALIMLGLVIAIISLPVIWSIICS